MQANKIFIAQESTKTFVENSIRQSSIIKIENHREGLENSMFDVSWFLQFMLPKTGGTFQWN